MFECDETTWPLLILRFSGDAGPEDEARYLDALRRLGETFEPFAVILVTEGGGHLSQSARRENNLIFKRHRDHLARYCRIMVRVRPGIDPETYDDSRMRRAMPFPAETAPSEEQARVRALAVLQTGERGQNQS